MARKKRVNYISEVLATCAAPVRCVVCGVLVCATMALHLETIGIRVHCDSGVGIRAGGAVLGLDSL